LYEEKKRETKNSKEKQRKINKGNDFREENKQLVGSDAFAESLV